VDLTRRQFLASGAAMVAAGCTPASASSPRFLSAATATNGEHQVAAFDAEGELLFRRALDFRGHEIVVAPDGETAVVVARRPGTLLACVDLADGSLIQQLHAAGNRHFYGHGLYTADGRFLLTSENDFGNRRGVVAIRDAKSLEVVDEFDSGGVGPHEMRWSVDARTLVVANGGLETHPDYGRRKLNVNLMAPNLAFLDAESGGLRRRIAPAHQHTSIRHIDVLADDRVVVAMQQEGESGTDRELVAVAGTDPGIEPMAIPAADLRELRQYTASVCVDRQSGNAIATCPRGNRVTLWQATSGVYKGSLRLPDAAGVAVDRESGDFVVTSGRGMIYRIDARTLKLRDRSPVRTPGLSWDNHLTVAHA